MTTILGAGLSGLICGALNAQAQIYERNTSDFVSHRAVLRFRDDKIARALGLDFRRVTVRKGIWSNGKEAHPTPRLANWYTLKTRSVIIDNSLWNMASAERFIAPDDLHAILADICGRRVHWCQTIDRPMLQEMMERRERIISTIPLPRLLDLLMVEFEHSFSYAPIYVNRYRIPDCDVFQTVYFPDPDLELYRATLTGELLTLESVGKEDPEGGLALAVSALGLGFSSAGSPQAELQTHRQSFGKISPVPNGPRKALLHRLTQEFGVYSIGRFATWRNILLDDVYNDIDVVRKMMGMDQYGTRLHLGKAE